MTHYQLQYLILLPSSTMKIAVSNGGIEPMKKERRSVGGGERERDRGKFREKRKKNKTIASWIFLGFANGVGPHHQHRKGGKDEIYLIPSSFLLH
jgi:hypothetical protein